ncbi:hypothetical protein LDENG_00243270 [Lucifuga dentata]|nr:hypothetical protein LDENG_00243270 [Lucifuga dentata]
MMESYVSKLNEFAQKTGSLVKYEELGYVGPDHLRKFTQRVVVNNQVYPSGEGNTKKEAKQNAAKNALIGLLEMTRQDPCNSTVDENPASSEEPNQNVLELCDKIQGLSVKSKPNIFKEINYVGIVNHYCQKTKRCSNFLEVERRGPSHNLEFCYKVNINNKDYPVAWGKNVKESKQNAAKLAWAALQEQSDWNSQVYIFSVFLIVLLLKIVLIKCLQSEYLLH